MTHDSPWTRLLQRRGSRRELLGALAALSAGTAALPAVVRASDNTPSRWDWSLAGASRPVGQYSDPGISDTEIKIGNSSAYSGPNAAYGLGSAAAYQAYFAYLNAEQGGINGRRITFISYDDGYDPTKTDANVRRLVEEDGVFLTAGVFGTAGTAAVLPYLMRHQVPLLFPVTSYSAFDDPARYPSLLMGGPSYRRSAEIVGWYWKDIFPGEKIGALTQAGEPGSDFLHGLTAGLGTAAKDLVATQTVLPMAVSVDAQVERLRAAGATLYFLQGPGKHTVQAIRRAHELGWRPLTYVAPTANAARSIMAVAGKAAADGAITTLTFKDPTDPQWKSDPALAQYRGVMGRYGPPTANPDDGITLQTYAYAVVLAELLRRMAQPTRESLLETARSLQGYATGYEVPGVTFNGSPNTSFLLKQAQFASYDGANARWIPFGSAPCGCA
jgi:branched-chain amino acid transport system substrate-binding protein